MRGTCGKTTHRRGELSSPLIKGKYQARVAASASSVLMVMSSAGGTLVFPYGSWR